MNWGRAWPKCAVPACENKCCLRLGSKYCWPHTPGTPAEALKNLKATEPPLEETSGVRNRRLRQESLSAAETSTESMG